MNILCLKYQYQLGNSVKLKISQGHMTHPSPTLYRVYEILKLERILTNYYYYYYYYAVDDAR